MSLSQPLPPCSQGTHGCTLQHKSLSEVECCVLTPSSSASDIVAIIQDPIAQLQNQTLAEIDRSMAQDQTDRERIMHNSPASSSSSSSRRIVPLPLVHPTLFTRATTSPTAVAPPSQTKNALPTVLGSDAVHPPTPGAPPPIARAFILCARYGEVQEVLTVFQHAGHEMKEYKGGQQRLYFKTRINVTSLPNALDRNDESGLPRTPLRQNMILRENGSVPKIGPSVDQPMPNSTNRRLFAGQADASEVSVTVGSVDKMGGLGTQHVVHEIIEEFEPNLIIMAGVCAGNPLKNVSLGDVVVAGRSVDCNFGRRAANGRLLGDSESIDISPVLVSYLHRTVQLITSDDWRKIVPCPKPMPLYVKKQHVLHALFKAMKSQPNTALPLDTLLTAVRAGGCETISAKELPQLLHTLGISSFVSLYQNLFGEECFYLNMAQFQAIGEAVRRAGYEYPEIADAHPALHVGTVACDLSSVRADLTGELWTQLSDEIAQRNLVGLDMESYALYKAVKDHAASEGASFLTRRRVPCSVVMIKGVSDLADPTKDDQFHKYSKQVSAAFAFKFLSLYGATIAPSTHA